MSSRVQLLVRGTVQGVGFRPFVFALARRRSLKGKVFNNPSGVLIDVEGEAHALEQFIGDIRCSPPPLASIESIDRNDNLAPANFSDFRIAESVMDRRLLTPVSADIATCDDCLRELWSAENRRYRYPFINCTNCGPRFTIIEGIPYDRAQTTMRDFAMCDACRREYENPFDRRFHAEPIACPECGPRLLLADSKGRGLPGDPLIGARDLLLQGEIVAIKGLGGYHLVCDALNADTVERLRRRKYREDRPFAMMANSIDVIRNHCLVSHAEEELLLSVRRPIVLLERAHRESIPPVIAPGLSNAGFMLPYTPLHYLLLEGCDRPLVMTSGNVSNEPICYDDRDAFDRLGGIADYFLVHDRRIHMRSDDSVARIDGSREMILRRSRSFAPAPIKTPFQCLQPILACGGELKNTFCLTRGNDAFLSHHIGDLENLETLRSFTEGIDHFKRLHGLRPEVVAYDLHPDYLSSKYAQDSNDFAVRIGVQHHHAHIASCLADNGIEGEVIGVVMDGAGFGDDGRLWGGEFFAADFLHAERMGHLAYIPMPGGTAAVRAPWRMAAVYLQRAFGDGFLDLNLPFVKAMDRRTWKTLQGMAASGLNSPETSSMGRLFDAVSSLLGLKSTIRYEGQAAIELEAIADRSVTTSYEFEVAPAGLIQAESVVRGVVQDAVHGMPASAISAKFHWAVAHLITDMAQRIRSERHLNRVALSGGVFQNMFLVTRTCRLLTQCGFEVLTHHQTPANDGGIALGQAAVANARLLAGRI